MTQKQVVEHWQKGAQDSLDVARMCFEAKKYEQALFQCQLAVEKALKAAYMEQHGKDHPHTHDLVYLAGLISHSLSEKDLAFLKELTGFVIDARYSDPYWANEQATSENVKHWISITETLLPSLFNAA